MRPLVFVTRCVVIVTRCVVVVIHVSAHLDWYTKVFLLNQHPAVKPLFNKVIQQGEQQIFDIQVGCDGSTLYTTTGTTVRVWDLRM